MGAGRYTVYILRCADGSLYTGITVDLERRLAAHAAGTASRYTRSRRPLALAWSRGRQRPTDARKLEYALKQLARADKLALVAGDDRVWRRLRRRVLGR